MKRRPTMTPREREVLEVIAQLPAGGIHERDLLRLFPGRHPNCTALALCRRGLLSLHGALVWVDEWKPGTIQPSGRVWRITREGLRALRGGEPKPRAKVRALAMALGGGGA